MTEKRVKLTGERKDTMEAVEKDSDKIGHMKKGDTLELSGGWLVKREQSGFFSFSCKPESGSGQASDPETVIHFIRLHLEAKEEEN